MKKLLVLTYGIINYLAGAAALVYLIAFTFNLYVPISVDSGEPGNLVVAAIIDIGLILLFGLQHSIMARPAFKKQLIRFIPQPAERSTYVLASAIVTFALCLLWQPLPEVIWEAENPVLYNTLQAIGLGGWALVFYSTFLINHFDLFGLRQVWLHFQHKPYTQLPFRLHSLYRYIRHPLMTGVFIGVWFTPVMSAGHLLLAIGMSAYIVIGVYHEEKDLINMFGDRYLNYIRSTARFFPYPGRKTTSNTPVITES